MKETEIIESIKNKDYKNLDGFIEENDEKAKQVFSLFKLHGATEKTQSLLHPKKNPIKITISLLEKKLQLLKGFSFLTDGDLIPVRNANQTETPPHQAPPTHSEEYAFSFGNISINDENSVELHIRKAFKILSIRKNEKVHSRYTHKNHHSLTLSKGDYQIHIDNKIYYVSIQSSR